MIKYSKGNKSVKSVIGSLIIHQKEVRELGNMIKMPDFYIYIYILT